jgi:AcrR family transcriptional regulator
VPLHSSLLAKVRKSRVAKRVGAGKSALYRRWPSKQEIVLAVLAEVSVPMADVADTGTLRGDIRASVARKPAPEPPGYNLLARSADEAGAEDHFDLGLTAMLDSFARLAD